MQRLKNYLNSASPVELLLIGLLLMEITGMFLSVIGLVPVWLVTILIGAILLIMTIIILIFGL